ncbi:unnamed protein product [Arctia plantaginis]|uniref:unspecific monooxygenase n=1 Tax=Arctia plantaginis TaxID=874455 RepID=A0A8S0YLJ1_ARCPL|nr:unnamed protein product [Arctia plantaginis]
MPFGEGPRICLGMRFAKMQVLSGLITVLKKYRLELAPGMKREVKLEPKSFVTHPIGGIQLRFIEREGWKDRMFRSSKSKVPS